MRNLTKEEIEEAYEKNTGVLIADEFEAKKKDILQFRQFFVRIMVYLHGVKMHTKQFTMQLLQKKLQRWQQDVR